ncbi:hypothetical protein NL676_007031 [Syzygium grande]|nr:hypothetical protein NL676_007031 [Syzygium grande]
MATTSQTPPRPPLPWVQEPAQGPPSSSPATLSPPTAPASSRSLADPDVVPSLCSFWIWLALAQAARVGPSPKAARATLAPAKILTES